MTARQLLVVDDEIGIRELLRDILQDEGYYVRLAENAAQARESRMQAPPDLVLLDIWMPDCDGITLLKEWGSTGMLTMPVVMMSGHGTIDTAVEATRIGAFDFLEKPIALQKLLKTVSAALKHGEQLPKSDMNLFSLGKSSVISDLRQRLEQLAHSKSCLLLIGEAGSGAELCAKFLHQRNTPWLELTDFECLEQAPVDILQSTAGGLIFISEIAQLNKTQQKGLQILISQANKHDVRIVCATSVDLPELVGAKQFDQHLFQMLSASTLTIPRLIDHREDVPDLVRAISVMLVESHAIAYREFEVGALNALRNADWPGNLTQLDNVVRNLMQTSLGDKITLEDTMRVLTQFSTLQSASRSVSTQQNMAFDLDQPLRDARDAFERIYFEHHIAKFGKNMSKVAVAAGLERTHLYRKLKQLEIKVK